MIYTLFDLIDWITRPGSGTVKDISAGKKSEMMFQIYSGLLSSLDNIEKYNLFYFFKYIFRIYTWLHNKKAVKNFLKPPFQL